MKNKKILLIILFLFSLSSSISAQDLCSKNGYTVLTINGIFTDNTGAELNANSLKRKLDNTYNNQTLTVNYVYNPTHLGGAGDLVDVVRQGLFDPKSDYDLVEMLNDASEKVKTQKLLIVGHSQGNFYANNFYDKVVDKEGGVPASSIGVYSVATPDKRVAGDGKYLTSDSDSVISAVVGRLKKIMEPNTHIDFAKEDDSRGHDFSKVYLKYRSKEIVRDIKASLDKLDSNNIQKEDEQCIAPQKISLMHKVAGVALVGGDFAVNNTVKAASFTYNTITSSVKSVAMTINKIARSGLALVGLAGEQVLEQPVPVVADTVSNPVDIIKVDNSNNNLNEIPKTEEPTIGNSSTTDTKEEVAAPDLLIIKEDTPKTDTGVHIGGGGGNSNTQTEAPQENPASDISKTEVPVSDTIAPVITINGDSFVVVKLNDSYTENGATAKDDKDVDTTVSITGTVDTSKVGEYIITYSAIDKAGNVATSNRVVKVSTYNYISKNSFGKNNGDGNNWQVWAFNGSSVYDWTDMYVGNYLHEQFKIQANKGTAYCDLCLQRGVFNHNPQKGFELSDVMLSSLEDNPQNNMDGSLYEVSIQWDPLGYTYNIYKNNVVYKTGHTNITNLTNDFYVGWDGSFNNFKVFPSGIWAGVPVSSPLGRTGGTDMILKPYPIYKESIDDISKLSLPENIPYTGSGVTSTWGKEKVTPFSFKIIYTDKNNIAPQKVELNIINKTTGVTLPLVAMHKVSSGTDTLSDGDFSNGEYFVTDDNYYDIGDYEYYFTSVSGDNKILRIPEDENLNLSTISSTYKYLPKYSFGLDDTGHDWQVWSFNGSNIYDWKDTYKKGYLHEQFKVQAYGLGMFGCSLCLQRGVFNHDPQKGFEASDFISSPLEDNPQNTREGKTYDVSIQWDPLGYSYNILDGGVVYKTGRVDIPNMNNNFWVGWDSMTNNFKNFPSGNWQGVPRSSPSNKTGGSDMVVQPYPVYDLTAVQEFEPTSPPVLSSLKEISSFEFDGLNPKVVGEIDSNNFTVSLTVPYGTSVSNISPTILISDKAKVTPDNLSSQNFTNPVTYIVEAEDGSKQSYVISVTIGPNPTPDPPVVVEEVAPSISSYTLNGVSGGLTINPLVNNLSLVLHANKNVNWMSIKIEKESDSSVYKIFQSGASCVDGSNICTKVWNGILSSGGLLQNGNYKIRVHVKDDKNIEYEEYLNSLITVNM